MGMGTHDYTYIRGTGAAEGTGHWRTWAAGHADWGSRVEVLASATHCARGSQRIRCAVHRGDRRTARVLVQVLAVEVARQRDLRVAQVREEAAHEVVFDRRHVPVPHLQVDLRDIRARARRAAGAKFSSEKGR